MAALGPGPFLIALMMLLVVPFGRGLAEPALRWGRVFRRKNAFSLQFVIRNFIIRRLVATVSRRWGIRSPKAYAAQKRSEVAVIPSLALRLVRMIFFFLLTDSFPIPRISQTLSA